MATLVQAVRLALHYGEEHLGVTDVFGEDVGPPLGGVFTATQGLKTAWNSPLDERGIIGTAMGIAYAGGRPVAEIQFCDYGFNTIDLLKVAGNQRWAGAGKYELPMVVMTPSGSGIRGSLYHSHSFESWASRLAGWKVVMPSNALDAYGLMLSAIADPNPVLVLLPKALLRVRGEQKIPGEPDNEDELKARIDAPVGDRSELAAALAGRATVFRAVGRRRPGPRGRRRHRRQLRPDAAAVRAGGRRTGRRDRQAFDVLDLRSIFPYDWKADRRQRSEDGPAAGRQRGHRGDELRRAPAAAGDRRALLRSAGAAAPPGGQARPRHRPEPGVRAKHRAAGGRTSRRRCGPSPRKRHKLFTTKSQRAQRKTILDFFVYFVSLW